MSQLQKALAKQYRYYGYGVLTLGEYLNQRARQMTRRGVDLVYMGASRWNYEIWFGDEGVRVPKVVWDTYPELPVQVSLGGGSWGPLARCPQRLRAEVVDRLGAWPADWVEVTE